MIQTSFRTTLFRNHCCTKEQNENKGNNIAIKVGQQDTMTAQQLSRRDFSQKCAENKGIQVRTKRDKCASATKKVRTNDYNKNDKQEGDKTHLGTSGNNVATLHKRTLFEQFSGNNIIFLDTEIWFMNALTNSFQNV